MLFQHSVTDTKTVISILLISKGPGQTRTLFKAFAELTAKNGFIAHWFLRKFHEFISAATPHPTEMMPKK